MEGQRVVVVVEEADAVRHALQWAVHNFLRHGDWITLVHVFPASRSRRKQRHLRLKGFQLALSFRDLCSGIPEAKVEIAVKEGEQAAAVVSLVNEIRASTLVLGLHEQSFLYRFSTLNHGLRNLNCRILAVKQHPTKCKGFVSVEFSQVEATHPATEDSIQDRPCLLLQEAAEEETRVNMSWMLISEMTSGMG